MTRRPQACTNIRSSGLTKTVTLTSKVVSTECTTLTTYVPSEALEARDAQCDLGGAVSVLESMHGHNLATACSCIGKAAKTTTTTTIITAAPVKSRTTHYAGTAPTTTLYKLGRTTVTITQAPTTTTVLTTTSCTTSTEIKSLAAPIFSRAYGPKTGCTYVADGPAHVLDASIDNAHNATQECQGLCLHDSQCSFVFVQNLQYDYLDGMPSFQCYFGDHHLDENHDLECGEKEDVYGSAVGFDAIGRGADLS